jgi:hypothetical protein
MSIEKWSLTLLFSCSVACPRSLICQQMSIRAGVLALLLAVCHNMASASAAEWYADSSRGVDSPSCGTSLDNACATIPYAYGLCAAGDSILLSASDGTPFTLPKLMLISKTNITLAPADWRRAPIPVVCQSRTAFYTTVRVRTRTRTTHAPALPPVHLRLCRARLRPYSLTSRSAFR